MTGPERLIGKEALSILPFKEVVLDRESNPYPNNTCSTFAEL